MKVGKPMSKRVTVRLRHRIEKASSAKQKKQRKEAKKNPQWVSRLKKDPGIPNLFPYKAKVLAEIEESKRKKQEEAQKRRDVAKGQRQGTSVGNVAQEALGREAEYGNDVLLDVDEDEEEGDDAMDEGDDSNPMAALLASAEARAKAYAADDGEQDNDEDEDADEFGDNWDGIQDVTSKSSAHDPKALPKQALADPVKAVSALMDRMRETTDGIQRLIDHYQIPALMTASTGLTSSFLVEVARKRGRLNRGGVPNVHSAALIVLSDLNEERLVLPSIITATETKKINAKTGQVQVVSQLAEPFRIEGLWGDTKPVAGAVTDEQVFVGA